MANFRDWQPYDVVGTSHRRRRPQHVRSLDGAEMSLTFYVGLHQPSDAQHFGRCCISIQRLARRKKPIGCPEVFVDCNGFKTIEKYGGYPNPVSDYAAELRRLHEGGIVNIAVAVSQDFMCEPDMIERTGLTVVEHQRLTIERYDALIDFALPVYVMPVLQGYDPADYARHGEAYGDRLAPGAWVGVGSVCKRNGSPIDVAHVLNAVHRARPDLRLHGFGLKKTAILDGTVRALLHSADSMAWSFHARKNGRSANDWREAWAFAEDVRVAALFPGAQQLALEL
jgi:hypothetical protein